ncbi:hypothetical protein NQ036_02310 [Brevibacterium sp. 91QC2O2]|uniref:hypothetical protein n=1 Tax=Brevibacterium sp. 91QC2O2 TaxID=2968458 RepID=UPI00211CE1B6|nr:hypothetical protein [Brevibacterium sp. 91QC2O2]MCQ9367080.1 hypothetical protein [Brevibacterium sp. 91QC2O2]
MGREPEDRWSAYAPLSGEVFNAGDPDGSATGTEDGEEPVLDAQGRRTIRFFEEWGQDSPYWETGNPLYNLEPADLGLSAELGRLSHRLMEFWTAHYDFDDTGDAVWDAEANRNDWYRRGDAVIERLRRELGPGFVISDERWS